MNDFFEEPPKEAIQVGKMSIPTLDWKSLKTGESLVRTCIKPDENGFFNFNPDQFSDTQMGVGFFIYDKEASKSVKLQSLKFYVFDSVSCFEGWDKKNDINYYTSRVFNTRTESVAVFMSGKKEPILRGFWPEIQTKALEMTNNSLKFKTYAVAWSPELGIIYVPSGAYAGNGMRIAMYQSINRADFLTAVKSGKYKNIGLIDNFKGNYIWGFMWDSSNPKTSLVPVNEKGELYAGKGELFYSPLYRAGTMPETSQYREQVMEARSEFRAFMANNAAKFNSYTQETAQQAAPTPQLPLQNIQQPQAAQTNAPGGNWGDMFPTTSHANTQAAQNYQKAQSPADANVFTPTDDLPF